MPPTAPSAAPPRAAPGELAGGLQLAPAAAEALAAAQPGTPETTAGGLDKSSRTIRDMFGQVARRYDLLNHLLSGGLDYLWRRRAAGALDLAPTAPGPLVLDLCAGTGDQAVALWRRGARVAAADFCVPMLALSRHKFAALPARRPGALAADALALPFAGGRFAGATVSFGLRNVADLDAALRQLAAVLRPGGRLVVLECATPGWAPLRALYLLYFRHVLPFLGRLISDSQGAYDYLPSSVLAFPQRQSFLDRMAAAGFSGLSWRDLSAGTICLYSGTIQPAAEPAPRPA
jgi:demethylmenaquinone methyltransferase / 2-methoxy-6-polyprenyl-1,4-benzoquinol methylase